MIETSSLYKALFDQGAIQDYQIVIDGVVHDKDVIYDHAQIQEKLFDTNTFTIGSFTVTSLKVKLWLSNNQIPRNAEVKFYYRYVSDEEQSEWILRFVGNVVDRTRYTDEITTITAFDKAANYDIFLDHFSGEISSYPANARTVANLCATHLGLVIDNISDVYNGNIVEYPNEMTIVQVLQNIAKASGGNWAIVGEDKLRMVVLENTTPTLEYPAQSVEQSELLSPISKVRVYWKDDSAFEAGDDSGSVLEIDNPWATQANTDYLLSVLGGYEYVPVSGKGVYADPALQLGDIFNYGSIDQTVAKVTWTFDGTAIANIETPQDNEVSYDNSYNILAQQEFKRKVTLGESYQGVSIGRETGIQMLLSPDGTEENATGRYYADLNKGMAMQWRDTPADDWHDWMYFDKNEKTFKLSMYSTTTEVNTKLEDIEEKIKDTTEWTIGNDGFWYADGVKTDKKAIGEDGTVADIWTIGPNGNWFKNGVDTGQPSQGQDGQTPFLHTAWANDDEGTDFSTTDSIGRVFLGTYVDFIQEDSENYEDYDWVFIKGETGGQGPEGQQGESASVFSDVPPEDPSRLWLDTTDNILKQFMVVEEDGEQVEGWYPVTYRAEQTLSSKLEITQEAINLEVSERQELENTLRSEISSAISLESDNITTTITSLAQGLDVAESEINKIQTYFTISGDGVILGKTGNPIEFYAEPDEVGFRENGVRIAYWKEGTMHVDNLIAIMTIIVGYHQIEKYDSPIAGKTSVVRRGDI